MSADSLGYLASMLVLATFCMRHMVALRLVAIASNLAFIAYGLSAGLDPVLLLHVLLLPLNAWRLAEARRKLGGEPQKTPYRARWPREEAVPKVASIPWAPRTMRPTASAIASFLCVLLPRRLAAAAVLLAALALTAGAARAQSITVVESRNDSEPGWLVSNADREVEFRTALTTHATQVDGDRARVSLRFSFLAATRAYPDGDVIGASIDDAELACSLLVRVEHPLNPAYTLWASRPRPV